MSAPPPPPGLTFGPLDTLAVVVLFLGFSGAAIFNGFELILHTCYTFKKRNHIYFYTLLVAASGIIIYQISVLLLILTTANPYVVLTFVNIGWVCMVTGQSVVLWSRLHLILRDARMLRWILVIILLNGLVFHGVETVFSYLSVTQGLNSYPPFSISEKVSLVVFSTQECIISCIYIFKTWKLLQSSTVVWRNSTRSVMMDLIAANLFVISMDIATFFLEIFGLWGTWCSFKGLAYSAKLKAEFHVLNQLRDLTKYKNDDSTVVGSHELDHSKPSETCPTTLHSSNDTQSKNAEPFSTLCAKDEEAITSPAVNSDGIRVTTRVDFQAEDAAARHVGDHIKVVGRRGSFAQPKDKKAYYSSKSTGSSEVEFAGEGA